MSKRIRLIDENCTDTFMYTTPKSALDGYISKLKDTDGEQTTICGRDEVSVAIYEDKEGYRYYSVNDANKHTNCRVDSVNDVDDWYENEWIILVEDAGPWFRVVRE